MTKRGSDDTLGDCGEGYNNRSQSWGGLWKVFASDSCRFFLVFFVLFFLVFLQQSLFR